MTTKSELLAKIKELQAQADAMPDDKVNPVFMPKKGGRFWDIKGGLFIATDNLSTAYFRTPKSAKAYGEAFQTILELHALSDAVSGEVVWGIIGTNAEVKAKWWTSLCSEHFFGRFSSKESAQAAIDKVGVERIQQAFNVLAKGEV